jgi:tetratricopeptide (TPR) repeat protein
MLFARTAYLLLAALLVIAGCSVEKRVAKKSGKAFGWYQEEKYARAGDMFLKIANRFPESNLYGRNLWNASWSYLQAGDTAQTVVCFHQILNSNLQDSVPDSTRGIHETHTNYKHYSCWHLSAFALRQGMPRKALQWCDSARYAHPFQGHEPKIVRRAELAIDQVRSAAYEKLGKVDSALVVILPYCVQKVPWNRKVPVIRAVRLIDTYFNRDSVAHELEQAEPVFYTTHAEFRFRQFVIPVVPYEKSIDECSADFIVESALMHWLCAVD